MWRGGAKDAVGWLGLGGGLLSILVTSMYLKSPPEAVVSNQISSILILLFEYVIVEFLEM